MHWLVYMASRFLAKLLTAPFVKIHTLGVEQTLRGGPFLLAGNHISHFDPPILSIVSKRRIDWMAMAELFETRPVAAWLRAIETFPVRRDKVDRQAVRTALERLAQGHAVGMFPEGGIRDGKGSVLMGAPMRPGVGAIAQMSGAPVIPCVIVGTDRLYAWGAWVPFRRSPVWVGFGAPLHCGAGRQARQEFERALGTAFQELFAQMKAHFELSEDDLPQPPARRKGRS